uniref:DUF7693 family protein n=1 Tax=Pseudomonas mohnii TaxID=395600 RepID=UPI003BB62839
MADHSWKPSSFITSPLTAHEVYLVLTGVALGKRIMMRSTIQSWNEIYHGLIPVEIDGWRLTIFNDLRWGYGSRDYPEIISGHPCRITIP